MFIFRKEIKLLWLPHSVGNEFREDYGEFHEAGVLIIVIPRGLEDELLYSLFFNGIDIGSWVLEHIIEEGTCRLRMAVQHVISYDLFSRFKERFPGFLVHIQDLTVLVTNSNDL